MHARFTLLPPLHRQLRLGLRLVHNSPSFSTVSLRTKMPTRRASSTSRLVPTLPHRTHSELFKIFFLIVALYMMIYAIKITLQFAEPNSTDQTEPESNSADMRRQVPPVEAPKTFFNLSSIRKLTKLAAKMNLNMKDANRYCKHNTTLLNCALNWPQILGESQPEMKQLNVSIESNGHDHCFTVLDEITCFKELNSTHTEVHRYELDLKPGTLELETKVKESYMARYILALGPENYLLFATEQPDSFCFLNLAKPSCQPSPK